MSWKSFDRVTAIVSPLCLSFPLGVWLGSPLHEFGHLQMARLVGLPAALTALNRTTVQMSADASPASFLMVVLAGPAFEILCGLLIVLAGVACWRKIVSKDRGLLWKQGAVFIGGLGAIMIISGAVNLVPFTHGTKASDGLQAIRSLEAILTGVPVHGKKP